MPDSGESAQALRQRFNAPMEGMAPDAAGLIWLDDAQAFHTVMGADLPLSTARELAAVQKPLAARAFGDAVSHAPWHNKPSRYLLTTNDCALQPHVQRLIADQLKGRTEVLASSHLSLASPPRRWQS